MTTNAFIFSWDMHGIESIVPISQYEFHDQQNLIRMLSDKDTVRNPMYSIMQRLLLRAQINSHRYYEIYAIDCDESLDEDFWKSQWADYPQETAELIRDRGQMMFSNRMENRNVKIT